MKIKNKFTGLILCLALSAASLTGCGGEKASEPVSYYLHFPVAPSVVHHVR